MNTPGSAHTHLVSELGERGLIERIRRRLPPAPATLLIGIGDDAAVYRPERGALQVLTTDALVEGVHFDRRFSTPRDIGYKALAVNVSDVAAMGGTASAALLSLMLPEGVTIDEVDGLLDGLIELAGATRVALAGGNITRSPGPLVIDVTVAGAVRPRKVLRRSGGRPGDAIYVTGMVGQAAAGLSWLRVHGALGAPDDPDLAACLARYRRPEPRARVGALLGRTRAATACMDLSDGLADAVRQIAEASGTGARVDASLLPLSPAASRWFAARGGDAVTSAISGGDDYELLFTVSPRARGRLRAAAREARGVPITRIGELTADRSVCIFRDGVCLDLPSGYTHF